MRELCFDIDLVDKRTDQLNDDYINAFIDFAVNNTISVGGNIFTGFCFCVDIGSTLPKDLKLKFVSFLKHNYSKNIRAIAFKSYDDLTDTFINGTAIPIAD